MLIKEFGLRNRANGKTLRIKRIVAKTDYLAVPKKRKKSVELIRKGIKKQLQYVKRDLQYRTELADSSKLQGLSGKKYVICWLFMKCSDNRKRCMRKESIGYKTEL